MKVEVSERTIVARIASWMNEIIEEERIPFEGVDSELKIKENGRVLSYPDITIFKTKTPRRIACIIEFKPPNWHVYDLSLIENAGVKAWKVSCDYFGTWNTNKLALWKTYERDRSLWDRRTGHYEVVNVKALEDVGRKDVEAKIKTFLKKFLIELHELYIGEKELRKLPLDEIFIYILRSIIESSYIPTAEKIKTLYGEDRDFKKRLDKWCLEQGWIIPSTDEDFDRIGRQHAHLLVDKLIFYNSLRKVFPDLENITVPPRVRKAEPLRKQLQSYFEEAAKKDYTTVFLANFVETLPLPDEVVPSFVSLTNDLARYDFSKLGYEILGNVFQGLIPTHERHKYGQYFTRSDVVDVINTFCVRGSCDRILDPACGAGTFLVRAYSLLQRINPKLDHKETLSRLYGIDISKFAVHLSTINLATMKLSEVKVHPKVIHDDFFGVASKNYFVTPPRYVVKTAKAELHKKIVPEFDVVVGNPPYTRQEELEDILPGGYKKRLEDVLKQDFKGFSVGRRAGIYAYFFIHGIAFLKNGGRFGFVTSNSWLDVDYGKYLQDFFLRHCKIRAVIESNVERWFEDADINTCITILERCKNKKERDNNKIKFVQLKKSLPEIIELGDETKRCKDIERLITLIENTGRLYEDDKIRVFPKKQEELWKEGFDEEENKYIGSKWSKYLKGPQIFFRILEKGKDLFIPLKEVAGVRRGFTTGANRFFYLTEEQIKEWGIETEFWMHKENNEWIPNYVIKSPREASYIITDPEKLNYRVLMVHKDKKDLRGTNVLKYIQWGEEQGFQKRPTCVSRLRWYDLGVRGAVHILWVKDAYKKHIVYNNTEGVCADCRFYEVKPRKKGDEELISAVLNSSLGMLIAELAGRGTLGLGARDIMKYEASNILVLKPSGLSRHILTGISKSFGRLTKRKIGEIFDEIGVNSPSEASLDRV